MKRITVKPHTDDIGSWSARAGKIKYGCAAWLLGLPLPIIILALFFRGCDF